ncbi:MAG: hypothetical protein LBE81_11080 [Azonexus sp.]|jgi:uncharacterized membrane protein YqiK|uniref:hypothetical protein n=1 Tax=Azonexus sp. TaxID=1872668 RepID=UPI00281ACCA7|nr:hypothetical protein [Azonexus sp.]MDR0777162.1 hypothetical protein [Azonexus sp.]
MGSSLIVMAVAVGIIAIFIFGLFALFSKFYRKVEQGYAMIVNTTRSEPDVTFTGRMVYPIIHKAEMMDIARKTIEIARTGKDGLICRDNIRADIKVTFFVQVNKTTEDVLKVAQGIGCARASNKETLEELFSAKFSEALKTVGKLMDFVQLYQERDDFRDKIVRQIGKDLSGYELVDVAIDYLEQTPLSMLDKNNILDAQGIKKITELTTYENVRTNEYKRNEEMQITKKNVETREAILELERQQADAEFKQQREIASVKAREEAEAHRIESEEHAKAELARLQAEQLIAVQMENVAREKEVAENNRKRVVAVEEEKVTRARQLEIVDREKEVTLQAIDKERAVEIQKKAIADVIRERVIVERTVAEQEEAIKEVRVVAEADRIKKSVVITAEGAAEEKLIKDVKEAEAAERRAQFKAAEELTLAEARLKVAEKAAEAKKREAEGMEAIAAAPGLAQAKVLLVTADAKEKQGMIDAKVKIADAEASEKQGMAQVNVRTAEAQAISSVGQATAEATEKQGMAEVKVRAAEGEAIASVGQAEADVIALRFAAEAKGLKEKFDAMKAMSAETRAHEEFRMQLERTHTETLKAIEAQSSIAREQAEVLGTAMGKANIDIVGGEGDYFERFVSALAVGKGIDGAISKSNTLKVGLRDRLNGQRDLVEDVKDLLGALGNASGSVQNLSIAALVNKVAQEGSTEQKAALKTLMDEFGKK